MSVEGSRHANATAGQKDIKYSDVVRFENTQRGTYGDLTYNPVFRSSALFYAVRTETIDTALSFMNYWKIKNNNPDIAVLITVRDHNGTRCARRYFSVTEATYNLTLSELLPDAKKFEGSIEVEVLSSHDLKYPMPAVEAFYLSPDGVSFVHANQRTFNGLDDMDRNSQFNGWQSGFDVYATDKLSGFVGAVNGPRAVKDAKAQLQLFNAAGACKELSVSFGELPAYASRRIDLSELEEARVHLGQERGWCKFNIDTDGVFNRLVCGNLSRDGKRLSCTHSYYDLSSAKDYVPASEIKTDEYTAFLPLPLIDGLDLDVVFYPIYSASKLRIDIERRGRDGKKTHVAEDVARFTVGDNRSLRLDVRKAFADRNIPTDGSCIVVVSGVEGSQIPARLTVGINYRSGVLGSNVSGSIFSTVGYGKRPRFYAWGPLMLRDGSSNLIILAHFDKKRDVAAACDVTVTLYGRSGVIGIRTLKTANGSCEMIPVEEWLVESRYQASPGEVVWYDATAPQPVYSAYQLHRSAQGLIGCDHSY